MPLLRKNQAVGIVALSNGLNPQMKQILDELEFVLLKMQISVVWPEKIFQEKSVFHATDRERAAMLMKCYEDDHIQAIFDVSGGDLANGILPYLDYDVIRANPKPFFGYSDLSVVVNALYTKTGNPTYLYQIRNLVGTCATLQQQMFKETLLEGETTLFDFDLEWIQGEKMSGEIVGGNIRCFLKLAGTPYLPDFSGKILLLESFSGDVAKMATYLNQYKQLGVFEQIEGVILGCFTEMEQKGYQPDILSLVQEVIRNPQLSIVKTSQIGHGPDSRCAVIGEHLVLER